MPPVASHFMRRVLIKVHIQKMAGSGAKAQSALLKYIERDAKPGRLYNDRSDAGERDVLAARGRKDRHQFRVILSPEDAHELIDLRSFTLDLVGGIERDLGTRFDWVAADHHDTGQPHSHLVIRGKRDDGHDLVIPKRYIEGISSNLATGRGLVGKTTNTRTLALPQSRED